jgi:hypothetical protein
MAGLQRTKYARGLFRQNSWGCVSPEQHAGHPTIKSAFFAVAQTKSGAIDGHRTRSLTDC